MATTIKLKNSVVKDKVPAADDIQIGELCVGAHADSPALFFKDNADNIIKIEPGSGAVPSPTPPESPEAGDLWFDSNNDTLNFWDGTGWVELGEAGDSAVKSVNTKTGAVVLDAADVGALASGDDVSELNNDAGYITLAQVPSALVSSVNTQTGDVVLDADDVGALKAGDDISELNNDAGYLTGTAANGAYLPLAGGTLTGDLTLERNDVENVLLSNDGSIKFSGTGDGEVFISAQTAGAGGYYQQTLDAGASGGVWRIQDSAGDDVVLVNADGSAEFKNQLTLSGPESNGNQAVYFSRDGNGVYKTAIDGSTGELVFKGGNSSGSVAGLDTQLILKGDGSAEFKGSIIAAGPLTLGAAAVPASEGSVYYPSAVDIRRDDGQAVYSVFRNGDTLDDITLQFKSDGSITAAGLARFGIPSANPGSGDDGTIINPAQGILITADNLPVFRGYALNTASPTSQINSDGTITAAGVITAGGFNIDALPALA